MTFLVVLLSYVALIAFLLGVSVGVAIIQNIEEMREAAEDVKKLSMSVLGTVVLAAPIGLLLLYLHGFPAPWSGCGR